MPVMAPQQAQSAKESKHQRLKELLAEADKSRTDAVTGERRCLGCGKAFTSLERLAQHLQDAHGSRNSPAGSTPAPGSRGSQLTFGDVPVTRDTRGSSRRSAPRTAGGGPQHVAAGGPWRPQVRPFQQSSLQRQPDPVPQPALSRVLADASGPQQASVATTVQPMPPRPPLQRPLRRAPLPAAAPASSATLSHRPTSFLAALKQDGQQQHGAAGRPQPLQQRKERLAGAAPTTQQSSTVRIPVLVPIAAPLAYPTVPPSTRHALQQGSLARGQAPLAAGIGTQGAAAGAAATTKAAGTRAAGAAPAGTKAEAGAPPPAPPPGTRLKSRRKRATRLKRAFRRGEAARAAQSWLEVLCEVEEALQATRELLGATANELEALEKVSSGKTPKGGGAPPNTDGTDSATAGRLDLAGHTSKMQLLQMVLLEAQQQEEELQRAHLRGRQQLERAQAKLLALEPGNGNSGGNRSSSLQQLLQQESASTPNGLVPSAAGDARGSSDPDNCSTAAASLPVRTPQLSAQPGCQPVAAGVAAPDAACLAVPPFVQPGTGQAIGHSQSAADIASGAAKSAQLASGHEGVAAGEPPPGLATGTCSQHAQQPPQVTVKQLQPASPGATQGSDPGSSGSSVSGLNWGDTLAAWLPPPHLQHAPHQAPLRPAKEHQGNVGMQQQQGQWGSPQLYVRLAPPPLKTQSPRHGRAILPPAQGMAARAAGATAAAAAAAGTGAEGRGSDAACSAAPAIIVPATASKALASTRRQPAPGCTAPPLPFEANPTGPGRHSLAAGKSSSAGGSSDSDSSGSAGLQWGDTLASWLPQYVARQPAAPAIWQLEQAAAAPALMQALPPAKPPAPGPPRQPVPKAPEPPPRSMSLPAAAAPPLTVPPTSQQPAPATAAATEVPARPPSAGAHGPDMAHGIGGASSGPASSSSSSGSSTDSRSSGGSGSSGMSMEWGDTLQAWAAHVKTQARGLLQGLAGTGAQSNTQQGWQGRQGQQATRQRTVAGQQQQQQQWPLPGLTASDCKNEPQAGKQGAKASAAAARPAPPAAESRRPGAAPPALPAVVAASVAVAAEDKGAVPEAATSHSEDEEGRGPSEEAMRSSSPPPRASLVTLAALHSWLDSLDPTSLDTDHQRESPEDEVVPAAGPSLGFTAGEGGPSLEGHDGQGMEGACCSSTSAAIVRGASQEGTQQKQQAVPGQPQNGLLPKGAFQCALCQVHISGEYSYQQHLGSKRHAKRLAQQAQHCVAEHSVTQQAVRAVHLAAQQAQQQPRTYVGTEAASLAPYVDQVITLELNEVATQLLGQLLAWQERVRLQDPANLKRKRRLLSGMREVAKALKTKRAKAVLVAPNINAVEGEEGEEYPVSSLLQLAKDHEIPVVFALSRQRMGKVLGPSSRKRVSAFAILDYDGANELFKRLLALAQDGQQAWRESHAVGAPALECLAMS